MMDACFCPESSFPCIAPSLFSLAHLEGEHVVADDNGERESRHSARRVRERERASERVDALVDFALRRRTQQEEMVE